MFLRNFCFVFFLLLLGCTPEKETLFILKKEDTGIRFENALTYTEEFNPYTYRNFYNGAGVALGDINNDGLIDLYFTGNITDNKLYLNKGNWQFEDITEKAGVACSGVWSTGATFVDINGDGFLDLYVAKSGKPGGKNRHNELFINQGNTSFIEKSKAYGLDVEGLSVHAAFLDYDKDGDLDCYVLNNSIRSVGGYDLIEGQRDLPDPNDNGNKFFENRDGFFVDVTEAIGMYNSAIGFGLGITVSDFNNDQWPDLFISNDFFEKDYLYLNDQGKGFTEASDDYFGSLSMGSMGADAADLDNDLQPDLLVTEMLPTSLERKKTKAKYDSWDKYSLMQKRGYAHQVPRNVLQRNMGGKGFFEVGRKSGVAATEWSWASLMFDMNNDGLRDIFIANGINKDLLDRDYLAYMANEQQVRMLMRQKEEVIKKLIDIMPSQAIENVAYENKGDFTFENSTQAWGLNQPSFSNGNAYGDLDNDGDLDLVVNNVNMPAFVYENKTDTLIHRSLQLQFSFDGKNTKAIGTKAYVYHHGKQMVGELFPSRGFQSTIPHRLHFGVGKSQSVDSVRVIWPDGKSSIFKNLPTNQLLNLAPEITTALGGFVEEDTALDLKKPFHFQHQENNFIEFNKERLLTQMRHNEGPALAVTDLNADGQDEVYVGGAKNQSGQLFYSTPDGTFRAIDVPFKEDIASEDTRALWVDVDQDGDKDLVVGSGGKAFSVYSSSLLDRVYINNGEGNFSKHPRPWTFDRYFSTKTIAAADVNKDGKQDLFLGERFDVQTYGKPGEGFLMLNQGEGKFIQDQQNSFQKLGMITDAVFTDLNGDTWPDLIVVGEWMPITIFMNKQGVFENHTEKYGLSNTSGLWNALWVDDFNEDGKTDMIVGNHGTNTFFEAGMKLFLNDFDANGSQEQIICLKRAGKYYPIVDKDELITQLPQLKKKMVYYADYAEKDITQIFDPILVNQAMQLQLDRLETTLFLGTDEGFKIKSLPQEVQYSPVYALLGISTEKNNEKSLYLGGNQYLVKPQFGRYDASRGWHLPLNIYGDSLSFGKIKSLNIKGQIRGILPLKHNTTKVLIFATNDDEVQFFSDLQ